MVSVVTDNVEDFDELFVRLNSSKPLTGAEIRNAMVGPVPDVIWNVTHLRFLSENIKFSINRAGYDNAAAKLVLFEYEGRPVSTKKTDLEDFARVRKDDIPKGRKVVDQSRLELAARRSLHVPDNMREVFLPHDEPLSSAGLIPVSCWLVRELPIDAQSVLREFLLAFEQDRKSNRQQQINRQNLVTDGTGEDNPIYSQYDTLNRSVNDVGSHVGRFDILIRAFDKWYAKQAIPLHPSVVLKR